MDLPFDGAISAFYREGAPDWVRDRIDGAAKDDILDPGFPYDVRWDRDDYDDALDALQIELVRLQAWVKTVGARVAIVFEGRDAAGKGGTIRRFRENLNPRGARVVAVPKPDDSERGQWYFQRYIDHLPSPGEIVLFDRSWYNRGVVEQVFGFCTLAERALFFRHVAPFERMLVEDGIHLVKIWLTVGRAEQLRRFLKRESDPLKQWKLSTIDVTGLGQWDAYTDAIGETLERSHSDAAPWTVVRADDKRRARVQTIRSVLAGIDYDGKSAARLGTPDDRIVGGVALWHDATRG